MMQRQIAAMALVFATLFGFAAGPAWGDASIRILVNDEPITSVDIEDRTKMLKLFTQGKLGQKDAIDQLITEQLMLQEAKRRNALASDGDVSAEFDARAHAAKMTLTQFRQALRQAGIEQTFKDFLRANVSWGRVVRSRFRATVNISELDVAKALASQQGQDTQSATEYVIQEIVFVVPSGSSDGVRAQLRKQAEAFRGAFQGCDHSIEQATGNPSIVVSPPKRYEQLPSQLQSLVSGLDVGGISKPLPGADGIQLFAVCGKKAISGRTEAEVQARDELSNERGQLMARRYLRDLRSDAVIEYP